MTVTVPFVDVIVCVMCLLSQDGEHRSISQTKTDLKKANQFLKMSFILSLDNFEESTFLSQLLYFVLVAHTFATTCIA